MLTTFTWAVGYHMRSDASDDDDLILGLRYCDDVARFDDHWLITARTAIPQWTRGAFPKPPEELKSTWHGKDLRHV